MLDPRVFSLNHTMIDKVSVSGVDCIVTHVYELIADHREVTTKNEKDGRSVTYLVVRTQQGRAIDFGVA